jgi:hypothetical protein
VGDFLSGVTAEGGATGLLVSAVVAVLGWTLRGVDKGGDANRADLAALNERHRSERDRAESRAELAERALAREAERRVRCEEYARALEDELRIPHRRWSDGGDGT